jgi:hypothetical protein
LSVIDITFSREIHMKGEDVAVVVGGILTVLAFLFLAPLLGAAFGAFSGWVVGLIFTDTMGKLVTVIPGGFTPLELGAALGFIGGFFKSTVTTKKSD